MTAQELIAAIQSRRVANPLQWSGVGAGPGGMLAQNSSVGPLNRVVFTPGRVGVGSGPDPGMVVPQDDPQALATQLAIARQNFEAGGGRNPYLGAVIGDTPGGAQSALLNLRAQNIQIAQEQARREEAARQAELYRALQAKIALAQHQLSGTELLDRLTSSAASRQNASAELDLKRLLGMGDIQTRLAQYGARYSPTDHSAIDALLPYGEKLSQAETENQNQIDNLLGEIQGNARNAAMANGLTLSIGKDGLPSLNFFNPAAADAGTYWKAENATYSMPGPNGTTRNLRAELNNLIATQNRLAAGSRQYDADLKRAVTLRNDRTDAQIPAAQVDALSAILRALQQQGNRTPTAVQTAAQRMLGVDPRATVISPTKFLPAPTARTWRLRNGAVTQG